MERLESAGDVLRLIADDSWRMRVLETVRALELSDCWVGAGFVRAMVWDWLHGHAESTPLDDVDVIFFDSARIDPVVESFHEQRLAMLWPADRPIVPWSVKNQARMHLRNGDHPYTDTSDALCHWLETPTVVAVRMDDEGELEILAPLGVDDLLTLRIAPTPHARKRRLDAYRERVLAKPWVRQWPKLDLIIPG